MHRMTQGESRWYEDTLRHMRDKMRLESMI